MTGGGKGSAEEGYSVDALTKLFGVNRRTLVARLKGASPVKSGAGSGKLYRLSDVAQGFIAQPLRGREADEFAAVRARKLEAETGLVELKLRRERGEVVKVDDVREDLAEVIRSLHTRLTVTMPQQLAPRLQAKTSRQAEEVLRAEMEGVFAELRREHVRYLAEGDAAEGTGTEG